MDAKGDRELEAAFRLEQLAKHSKLLDQAKGITRAGRLPMLGVLTGVGVTVAYLLAQNQRPVVILEAVVLMALVSAAVKELNNRIDALITLLERAQVIGPDLPR